MVAFGSVRDLFYKSLMDARLIVYAQLLFIEAWRALLVDIMG
jgi:hypothetical protein